MREILFRGQTRRKGEKVRMGDGKPIESNWVYGGIFPNNNGGDYAIIYQQEPEIEKFTVYADTVCMYSGKTDKNGKKIFDKDILLCEIDGEKKYVLVEYGEFQDANSLNNDRYLGFYVSYEGESASMLIEECEDCSVVGNIFDNPDLLTTSSADSD